MLNTDPFSLADPPLGGRWDWAGFALALEGGQCEAYNEDAFQYFLEIERKRCQPSNRPLLLLLIEVGASGGAPALSRAAAAKFFSTVSRAVRETARAASRRGMPRRSGARARTSSRGKDRPGAPPRSRLP